MEMEMEILSNLKAMLEEEEEEEEEENVPVGFRFKPTDEEILNSYLRNKVFGNPLPSKAIIEQYVYSMEPWILATQTYSEQGGENDLFFFTKRCLKYPKGKRPSRSAGNGFWKATGAEKKIFSEKSGKVIGAKRPLVYYRGKPSEPTKTDWLMQEYTLCEGISKEFDQWAVCRIKYGRNHGKDIQELIKSMEEEQGNNNNNNNVSTTSADDPSWSPSMLFAEEEEEEANEAGCSSSYQLAVTGCSHDVQEQEGFFNNLTMDHGSIAALEYQGHQWNALAYEDSVLDTSFYNNGAKEIEELANGFLMDDQVKEIEAEVDQWAQVCPL